MIYNSPLNQSVIIPGTGNYVEVFRVGTPNVSATVNIRVITTNLALNIGLELLLVPDTMALAGPFTDDMYLQPKNINIGPAGAVSGIIEDTGVVIPAGKKLIAKATAAGLVARLHGYYRIETPN